MHYKFPKDSELRQRWTKLVNRQKNSEDKTLWEPNEDSVVCSIHFENGKPSHEYPLPTKCLGYNVTQQLGANATVKPRKREFAGKGMSLSKPILINTSGKSSLQDASQQVEDFMQTDDNECQDDSYSAIEVKPKVNQPAPVEEKNMDDIISDLTRKLNTLQGHHATRCMHLKSKTKQLKQFLQPLHKRLLKADTNTNFYTGIPQTAMYISLCRYLKEFERQRNKKSTLTIQLKYKVINVGEKRTCHLLMEDKVLLTLMKLRLGLLHKDLADRLVGLQLDF